MAQTQAQKKRKKKAVSPFTILLIITAVLTMAAVALVLFSHLDVSAGKPPAIADAPAGEQAFTYEFDEASSLQPLGSTRLLRISKSQIDLLNLSGSSEETINTTMVSPHYIAKDDYGLVYDQGGKSYYLFNRNGLIHSGSAEDPIESASVSQDGLLALILDQKDTNGVLRVLAADGSMQMEWVALDSQNSGYVIRADFATDSSYVDVSLLNTTRTDTGTILNRFSLEDKQVGERLAQFHIDGNKAVLAILNSREKTAFVTDRTFYTVTKGNLAEAASFASISSLSSYGEGAAIVATDTIGGRYQLYCINDLGSMNPGKGLALGESPGAPLSRGRYTALADGDTVYLVTDQKAADARRFDLKSNVLSLGIDEQGHILVVTRDEVRRITP